MTSTFATRFAPSPTGLLHLGHAFSALTAFRMADEVAGRFLLRIEDIDHTRCKPAFEDAIYEDLTWLGLTWEHPVRRQSAHLEFYEKHLAELAARGLAYRCFKTRKEVMEDIARAPHLSTQGPEGPIFISEALPVNEEQNLLQTGESFAWRLSTKAVQAQFGDVLKTLSFTETGMGPNGESGEIKVDPLLFGDVIIGRKDAGTSYHLSCVLDDALQGVTHIIRGEDLFHASHLHRVLQMLFNLPAPTYHHHALLTDEHGKKFSKRDKSLTLREMRHSGMTQEGLRNLLELAE